SASTAISTNTAATPWFATASVRVCVIEAIGVIARPSDPGRERDAARQAGDDAVDAERRQPVGLEEPQQELDGHVGRRGGAERSDERWPAHAVAGGPEQVGHLQERGGADDRRGEQEGEA